MYLQVMVACIDKESHSLWKGIRHTVKRIVLRICMHQHPLITDPGFPNRGRLSNLVSSLLCHFLSIDWFKIGILGCFYLPDYLCPVDWSGYDDKPE